jgi:trypsin-like peptidase
MLGGQVAVTRATAAVFAGGRRTGSAVLVSSRYLVTAAHVLLCLNPGTGARVPTDHVVLEFPGQGIPGQAGRLAASRFYLGPASREVDLAVLDLGEDLPTWLPVPVPVWPAVRLPGRVKVFGYPLAEGPLNGVYGHWK